MNLHGVVSGAVGAVNPPQLVTIKTNTGYTTAPGGVQTPTFTTTTGLAQVQELSSEDIKHLGGINTAGLSRKLYASGSLYSIVRVASKGGDRVILADGSVWLVTHVIEMFPDWCSVAIEMQVS